ncbi:MAG: hypothetical protein KDI36_00685 [Pseudomonadales bacterium]|nr:hypothetical protein [Pseudomonadales bacterium]
MGNTDTIQLIKCEVVNSHGERSYRLIERDNFNLWKYLVTTRHHITIETCTLALWVAEDAYAENEAIYSRAGDMEASSRIILMMYDDVGNFQNTCRYCLQTDQHAVESILVRHLPPAIRDSQQYSVEKEAGRLILKGPYHQLGLLDARELETV